MPVVPISYSTPTARQAVSDADLLAASVRIRVEDRQGHNCGSGTIIDALPGGEALVLTCGHLFRDSEGKGKIESTSSALPRPHTSRGASSPTT